jgi:hypothetical protein
MKMVQARYLVAGDRTATDNGDIAEILAVTPARWVKMSGTHAYDVRWKIISGSDKGSKGYALVGATDELLVTNRPE